MRLWEKEQQKAAHASRKSHLLNDIQIRCARASNVHNNGLHQRSSRKILNFLRHGGAKEQRLPLRLRAGAGSQNNLQ